MALLAVAVGIYLLIKGGDWLMQAAVALSLRFSIPKIVIGMTVVSFATSAPELIISIKSALTGHPDLALGNVVGSNIANLGFVLAITLIISPISVSRSFYRTDWPMMILSSLLFYYFISIDQKLDAFVEQFLMRFKGAVVLVSHDIMFLDQVTNRTIEIVNRRHFDLKKSYTPFMSLRGEMRAQQQAAQKNQEKQIQQTEKLIERFRAKASKATMAQSLVKKLEKVERIEVDAEQTEVMKLKFPVAIQPGKMIFETNNLGKSYGEKQVLNHVDLYVERGTKLAFVGQNGQGKSTLAKLLVGDIEGNGGLRLGHNVKIGYFAQNQSETLAASKTVLNTVQDVATNENRSSVRDLLGAFLFRGDDVDKKVSVLSGGERNRLALCKLLLQPFNILVMDEPTNHLDIQSKHILKEALMNFEGTLILVSHDRDFLSGLCNQVLEFKDGQTKLFLDDVNTYLENKKLNSLKELEKTQKKNKSSNPIKVSDYALQKKEKSLKNKLSKLEAKISNLEQEIKVIDLELEINYDQTISAPNFFDSYQEKKRVLVDHMETWEQLVAEIENLNQN